jgi:hypothetical protein
MLAAAALETNLEVPILAVLAMRMSSYDIPFPRSGRPFLAFEKGCRIPITAVLELWIADSAPCPLDGSQRDQAIISHPTNHGTCLDLSRDGGFFWCAGMKLWAKHFGQRR